MRATEGTHPRPADLVNRQAAGDRAQDVNARRVVVHDPPGQLVQTQLVPEEWWEPGVAWLMDEDA